MAVWKPASKSPLTMQEARNYVSSHRLDLSWLNREAFQLSIKNLFQAYYMQASLGEIRSAPSHPLSELAIKIRLQIRLQIRSGPQDPLGRFGIFTFGVPGQYALSANTSAERILSINSSPFLLK
ncbi:hypothetical protein Fmac_015712 [Flemingia macrophylla]|uniref:Uncharacterized protein n=1 Tax=Flemingia macrophylla TaxID=520843 RepID=A0ABD1MFB1_9FABA